MGLLNTLTAEVICPYCGANVRMRFQFKYGAKRMYEYELGDRLRWGLSNDEGVPGVPRVLVEAIAEPCPSCHTEDGGVDYDDRITIERDVLMSVRMAERPRVE